MMIARPLLQFYEQTDYLLTVYKWERAAK